MGRWIDGLEAIGRAALFVLLFLALLMAGALLLQGLGPVPVEPGRFHPLMIAQFGLALAAALLAGWLMLRFLERRPEADLGFPLRRDVPRALARGLLAGAAAPVLAVAVLAVAGAFRFAPDPGSAAGWLVTAAQGLAVLAIPAAAEEAIFRGYAFRTLVRGLGPVGATVLTSAAFALLHGQNPEVAPLALVNIFLAGVALAYAVLRTGGLWFASAVHLGWNWSLGVGLDLPVSGLEPFDPPLYDGVPAGPDWLTGGAFGPEGGLAGTLAAGCVVALIWWFTRSDAGAASAGTGEGSERVEG